MGGGWAHAWLTDRGGGEGWVVVRGVWVAAPTDRPVLLRTAGMRVARDSRRARQVGPQLGAGAQSPTPPSSGAGACTHRGRWPQRAPPAARGGSCAGSSPLGCHATCPCGSSAHTCRDRAAAVGHAAAAKQQGAHAGACLRGARASRSGGGSTARRASVGCSPLLLQGGNRPGHRPLPSLQAVPLDSRAAPTTTCMLTHTKHPPGPPMSPEPPPPKPPLTSPFRRPPPPPAAACRRGPGKGRAARLPCAA